jgi:hypothetical protein
MRNFLVGSLALGLLGCGSGTTTFVHSDTTTLGRVVVYRNGVAYFERYARENGDKLTLAVPADKVDDFLKSLNVVDAHTGDPAPVAYPTSRQPTDGTGLIDMQIALPGKGPHELRLSYVTEAPAWKPSYRVVLGTRSDKADKVDLVGWAIVDNTSGEDWKNVRLGVGASSALAFRFDLRSIRVVERETLRDSALFALAPPTGQATYGAASVDLSKKVIGDFGDDALPADAPAKGVMVSSNSLRQVLEAPAMDGGIAPAAASAEGGGGGAGGLGAGHGKQVRARPASPPRQEAAQAPAPRADALTSVARRLASEKGTILVEGYAGPGDQDKDLASLERANRVREKLIRDGLDPARVVAVGKGEAPGHAPGARIVEGPAPAAPSAGPGAARESDAAAPLDPIGTSSFESTASMNVPRGTSAMVSILHAPAEGEVVYLYDPESPRGNRQFAFKALRLRNPTDSQLESGPVTVFGEDRFIGEGLCEPIPARQVAFVPFALDRQVVVDDVNGERDEIARLISVQRGVFSTQMQHVKKHTLMLHNRLPTPAVVYVRHAVAPGYRSSKAPATPEHVGGADLYRVEVEPLGKREIVLEDTSDVYRSTDIRSPDGLELVRAYVSSGALSGQLRSQIDEIVKAQREIGDDQQRISTLRDQMGEFRQRMDELHAQIVTLRAVRTAGPLMASLEHKLQEISDKLSKGTIDVVALEEKLMLSRIKMQDMIADLTLEPAAKDKANAKIAGS